MLRLKVVSNALHSLLFHLFPLTLSQSLAHEAVSQGLLLRSLHETFGTKSTGWGRGNEAGIYGWGPRVMSLGEWQ